MVQPWMSDQFRMPGFAFFSLIPQSSLPALSFGSSHLMFYAAALYALAFFSNRFCELPEARGRSDPCLPRTLPSPTLPL